MADEADAATAPQNIRAGNAGGVVARGESSSSWSDDSGLSTTPAGRGVHQVQLGGERPTAQYRADSWSSDADSALSKTPDTDMLLLDAYQGGEPFAGESAFDVPDLTIHKLAEDEIQYHEPVKTPKILGDYLLGEMLGKGAFGKVKEATNVNTLRRMAVKIMHNKKLRRQQNGQANARKEITLLKRLKHPNIIELVDVLFNWHKQKMYLFMEYCAATVQEVLASSPDKKLPLHQAHDYFKQLLDGLEYAHSQSVVHRDIKPSNLLLTNDQVLKLSDFGVADILDRFEAADKCTSSLGTTVFQPPEIANAAAVFSGCKVDVWAAGVTLWNMTTGSYPFPFENATWLTLLTLIGKGDYTIPDGVDPVLAELLVAILEKNPDERLSVQEIQQHRWLVSVPSDFSQPRVPIPAREHDDDIDRGTTIVPTLYAMHDLDQVREYRLSVPLDDTVTAVDVVGSPRIQPKTSMQKVLASLFSK